MSALPREFYGRDTVAVARGLLGKRIVRRIGRRDVSVVITETEAYGHRDDPASHAFRSMTERNRAMFGQVGMAYVYFTYGMHYCFNVVARGPGSLAGAVLIRAARPESGADVMARNRKNSRNICDGPARLTQALGITKAQYGADLTERSGLYIAEGDGPGRILAGPRVGIRRATGLPWNFRAVG